MMEWSEESAQKKDNVESSDNLVFIGRLSPGDVVPGFATPCDRTPIPQNHFACGGSTPFSYHCSPLVVPVTPLYHVGTATPNGSSIPKSPAVNAYLSSGLSVIPSPKPGFAYHLYDAPVPALQNIVATASLGVSLDLRKIALHTSNAEYDPKRFSALIMRLREPKSTALIFSSGKLVCTGTRSEENSKLAARKFGRIVQKLGFGAQFGDFKIQNMVGSCDVRFPIFLEGLSFTHGQFTTYEPELFPGLVYRMVKPRVVILVFATGKVVITGARVKKDIDDAFKEFYPILRRFKK